MMYYNKWGATVNPANKNNGIKPIEYAFKDEVDYLKSAVDKHDAAIVHCLQAINENRNDCKQMYQAIDMLKYDAQQVKQIVDYLHYKVEYAPSVAKRKRRVTICADGQRVEVCRYD